uniref:uncharacterized protein LOC100179177 n=1 Tax=Ciona intestinalis TaxID=7719 RepID=UPI000EF4A021|nr:uncharacterized protein LOC100179177 [Ciona intestinalis]|eukprot:XP_002123192.2 uncharacterized protein LOC100179177 [Ciona intestinalis]
MFGEHRNVSENTIAALTEIGHRISNLGSLHVATARKLTKLQQNVTAKLEEIPVQIRIAEENIARNERMLEEQATELTSLNQSHLVASAEIRELSRNMTDEIRNLPSKSDVIGLQMQLANKEAVFRDRVLELKHTSNATFSALRIAQENLTANLNRLPQQLISTENQILLLRNEFDDQRMINRRQMLLLNKSNLELTEDINALSQNLTITDLTVLNLNQDNVRKQRNLKSVVQNMTKNINHLYPRLLEAEDKLTTLTGKLHDHDLTLDVLNETSVVTSSELGNLKASAFQNVATITNLQAEVTKFKVSYNANITTLRADLQQIQNQSNNTEDANYDYQYPDHADEES